MVSKVRMIWTVVGKPVEQIRQLNFYTEGQLTPYREKLVGFNAPQCWDGVQKAANWSAKLAGAFPYNQ